jgi:hypothetical protein
MSIAFAQQIGNWKGEFMKKNIPTDILSEIVSVLPHSGDLKELNPGVRKFLLQFGFIEKDGGLLGFEAWKMY